MFNINQTNASNHLPDRTQPCHAEFDVITPTDTSLTAKEPHGWTCSSCTDHQNWSIDMHQSCQCSGQSLRQMWTLTQSPLHLQCYNKQGCCILEQSHHWILPARRSLQLPHCYAAVPRDESARCAAKRLHPCRDFQG